MPVPLSNAEVEKSKLRATYSLRFLVDAFSSSKRHLISRLSMELSAFLNDAVGLHLVDVLQAKIAVEAAGILNDDLASALICGALRTGNYWIMETAIRAARNITAVSSESFDLIKKYLWQLSEFELLKKRRDFVDLFRLNTSFKTIPMLVNARAAAIFMQWPIRLVTLVLFADLYLLAASLYLGVAVEGIAIIFMFGSLPVPSARVISQIKAVAVKISWRILTYLMRVESLFLFVFFIMLLSFLFGNDRLVNGGYHPEIYLGGMVRSVRESKFLSLLFAASCISVGDWARIENEVVKAFKAVRAGGLARGLQFLNRRAAIFLTIVRLAGIKNVAAALLGAVGVLGVFALIIWFLARSEFGKIAFVAICSAVVLVMVGRELMSFFHEWRRIRMLPTVKFEGRSSIDEQFRGMTFGVLRGRLVDRIESYHRKLGTRPRGFWPRGAAPNLGDRASIRLAQLDETWAGLDR